MNLVVGQRCDRTIGVTCAPMYDESVTASQENRDFDMTLAQRHGETYALV